MSEREMSPPREDVRLDTGDGCCAAWLYMPDGTGTPPPVVVLVHGMGGIRQMRLDAVCERFQAVGYACLAVDYRHFGASDGEPRQLLDIDRQLADVAAALRYVRGRADLDPARVVLWGTSFGGGHVLLTAAREDAGPGVAAVIAQCPFTDGLASALATRPRSAWAVVRRSVRDRVAARRGRQPIMVATAGPPGSAALMTAPDAESGYLALVPDQPHGFRNEVAARVGLSIICHRPGRYTASISCPVLFNVCDDDTVAPARTTIRHARRAPRAEIHRYPTGHFDIYRGRAFEHVINDQIEFLTRHVSTEIRPRS